jgi:hypothetical protein
MPSANIFVLPKSCDDTEAWDRLIDKSKSFRLAALREAPEAFSSTLANEQTFSKDIWEGRLRNPRATTTVTLSSSLSDSKPAGLDDIHNLLEREWLALTALIRPEDQDVSQLSASKSPWASIATKSNDSAPKEVHNKSTILFVLNGVYVVPNARQGGVGSAHLKGSIEVGNSIARAEGVFEVHYQVRVNSANTSAVKLYQRSGFMISREETLATAEKEKDGVVLPAHEACIWVMDLVVTLPHED